MSKSLNKVQLIGNLGKDPELKYTSAGVAVATFSIATSDSWKDQEGNTQERTEWHNIVAWRKLAEICGNFLSKGKLIFVDGRIRTQSWEDKEGNKRYTTEIVAANMQMLDSKGQGKGQEPAGSAGEDRFPSEPNPGVIPEDDVPF